MNIRNSSGIFVGGHAYSPITQSGRDASVKNNQEITSNISPEIINALTELRKYAEKAETADGNRLAEAVSKAHREASKPESTDDTIVDSLSRVIILAQNLTDLTGPVKDAFELLKKKIE